MPARNYSYPKLIAAFATVFVVTSYLLKSDDAHDEIHASDVYGFNVTNIDGEEISMKKYAGKVTLVVNVASEWGLTNSNYAQLNQLHDTYSPDLAILAFPSNQFGGQEPRSDPEIKQFALEKGAQFEIFSKIDVNGANAISLYKYLKKEATGTLTNDIKWNYTKFLITKSGKVFRRYSPHVDPMSIANDIEYLMKDAGR